MDHMKFIEVRGISFTNKGAELMLLSLLDHFKSHPGIQLVVESDLGPYLSRAKVGLFQKLRIKKLGEWDRFISYMIPKRIKEKLGICDESQIFAVLDASGFSYSDQWGPKATLRALTRFKRWKRQGKKIIMMPQAFGPFEIPVLRKAAREMLQLADLIFCRDEESLKFLNQLEINQSKIFLTPDFTPGLTSPFLSHKEIDSPLKRAAIVPNLRMVDKGSYDSIESYIEFLNDIRKVLVKLGYQVELLVHEKRDLEFTDKMSAEWSSYYSHDPLELKARIASSDLVIGSRYHALISSLSQAVPTIGFGWSHKYKELFRYYDSESFLLPEGAGNLNLARIQKIIEEQDSKEWSEKLARYAETHKSEVQKMWAQIDEFLNIKSSASIQKKESSTNFLKKFPSSQ